MCVDHGAISILGVNIVIVKTNKDEGYFAIFYLDLIATLPMITTTLDLNRRLS